MSNQPEADANLWRQLLIYLGLARPDDGVPKPGAPRRSRYGLYVSPRLDQDIDDLRQRLDALEKSSTPQHPEP